MPLSEAETQELLETVRAQSKQIAALTEAVKNGEGGVATARTLRAVTERTVRIKFVDGKPVVAFKNRGTQERPSYTYERTNPADPTNPNNRILYVDIIKHGDAEATPVQYKEFVREAHSAVCKVVKIDEEEWVMDQGVVKKKEVDGYSMVELDYDVPVEIVGKTRFFTVALPQEYGGGTVKVHEAYVNI